MPDFKALADQVFQYMTEMRRHLHRRPCLSGDERETTEFIARQMDDMGIPYHIDEVNNLIAKIEGAKPGRRIALRADTDALPMQEATGLPFASEKPGVMHACGHDLHVANLLGVAKVLQSLKDRLAGSVYLCFQVSEEILSGAPELVDYLERQGGVDGCFGLHVMFGSETGMMTYKRGATMSGSTQFTVTVTGAGGHGSTPWLSSDPIKPACEILLRLAALPASRFSAFDPVVINPCMIQSGSGANIIPDQAVIRGNVRYFRTELYGPITAAIREISHAIGDSCGVDVELSFSPHHPPPIVNTDEAVVRFERVVKEQGIPALEIAEPWMATDNFSEFVLKYGGMFCFGGITKKGEPVIPVHNVKFSPDEEALRNFCRLFLAYTWSFLSDPV